MFPNTILRIVMHNEAQLRRDKHSRFGRRRVVQYLESLVTLAVTTWFVALAQTNMRLRIGVQSGGEPSS